MCLSPIVLAPLSTVFQANLRSGGRTGYFIPYGDWFSWVSCPHYLAEVTLYLGLLIVGASGTYNGSLLSLEAFIIANLASNAAETHAKYNKRFEDYPQNRWAMIPYVL